MRCYKPGSYQGALRIVVKTVHQGPKNSLVTDSLCSWFYFCQDMFLTEYVVVVCEH